jgi:heat-inducible transcriptional repressor
VVRAVQLVLLHPRQVLVVAVLSTGAVEKQLLHLEEDADDGVVGAAVAILERQLLGQPWSGLPELSGTGDPHADAVAVASRDALVAGSVVRANEPVYVGGVSRLAAEQEAFPTAQSAARLLEMLEHQVVVVSLVRELLDAGVNVSIGSENRLADLRECSIVVSPYAVDGVPAGIVGVLGPTRMDYRHALAAVTTVSQQLGRHLS